MRPGVGNVWSGIRVGELSALSAAVGLLTTLTLFTARAQWKVCPPSDPQQLEGILRRCIGVLIGFGV